MWYIGTINKNVHLDKMKYTIGIMRKSQPTPGKMMYDSKKQVFHLVVHNINK